VRRHYDSTEQQFEFELLMRFIISLALIIGFCVLLLVGLLNVLRDLFARSVHQQPSIPAPEPGRRHDGSLSEGQSLSGV
jgi:hypothetical protein